LTTDKTDTGTAKRNRPVPFRRKVTRPKPVKMFAYDLETTRIEVGTPEPLYITGYGDDGEFLVSEKLTSRADLLEVLATRFLIPSLSGCRFVGWNANNFDVYLVALSLLLDDRYEMRPYMTRSKSLRGMRVKDLSNECEWEFLDGMAMTGCMMKLEKFLTVFAPDLPKMSGAIDWEKEGFDASKQSHVEYAMRDSVGLFYALQNAQKIIRDTFGQVLRPTIGNMGIKIFQSHIPKDVTINPLAADVDKIMRDYVMRGGYCYCVKRYTGKVWKYDLNQAYAAAMREAWLPSGYANPVKGHWARYPGIYRITATRAHNRVPFYYSDSEGDRIFGMSEIGDTWITSIEYEQLQREGWRIELSGGYLFTGRFKMQEYVDTLETLRMNAPGGSSGAQGTLVKAVGNNSYGKTVEQLDGVEYVIANECPEGFLLIPDSLDLPMWEKRGEPQCKDYHKPQIGAFITAHVRMKVRQAALLNPGAWLYADTDCVVFSCEPKGLDIHPSRYGAWKVECEGEEYRIITKKVYAKIDASEKHAKGMNVKKLTAADFERWSNGEAPTQTQIHKNNLTKVLAGADMFIERVRRGTKV